MNEIGLIFTLSPIINNKMIFVVPVEFIIYSKLKENIVLKML